MESNFYLHPFRHWLFLKKEGQQRRNKFISKIPRTLLILTRVQKNDTEMMQKATKMTFPPPFGTWSGASRKWEFESIGS